MSSKPKDVKNIFAQALEQDSAQARAEFLDQACADDAKLRQRIERLLKSHDKAGDFLEVPPADCDMILDAPSLAEGPGTVIGPYKLLEELGEGGMAVVYMAEQDRPLRRRVALKIIKLGMDTKQVIARFDAERQALALMDHPNIARVFDAGATETGRPYFVMELVRGISITRYCDENKLNTKTRLELFALVCNAVHHAHQKGIIHRDLKPSNIMVTLRDGAPIPKVIDFGIAKATNQRLTEHTVFTRYAEMIGTPEYMSPEQAEMSELDIDTRTDIYSLGIVLYELLTGALPFDAKTLRAAALGEIQRIIREEEPLRPSTRISTLGKDAKEIAARRCTDVGTLTRYLSKELEWIPLKALRKDRTRRYRSASEFADDIQNYLHDRPLLAGPESPLYKLRKTVHKHRIPVVAGVVVVIALVVGLIISTSLYLGMHRALDRVDELNSQIVHDSLAIVQRHYTEGRYQDGLNEIKARFDEQDLRPQVRLLRAQLHMELGEVAKAGTELDHLTQAESEIAGAAHSLLAILNMTVDPNKAQQHQKLAESMLPQTAEGFYLRGMCAASADDAVKWLSDALRLDSRHYAAHKARALALHSLKRYQTMTEDTDALVDLRPYDYLGYALRAIIHREAGQFTLALKDHDHAIALCQIEDERPRLYDQRITTHMRSGNYQAALEDARKHNAPFSAFTALLALGEYDAAVAEYQQVAKMGMRSSRFFKTMAEGHVFDLLSTGQSLDLPAKIAQEIPFCYMAQAAALYKRLNEKGRPLGGGGWLGDWSPDGQAIVYSRFGAFSWLPRIPQEATSSRGTRFIEIRDLRSDKTSRITLFGRDPLWSPDDKTIAFTHSQGNQGGSDVWLVPSAGGTARKLTEGTAVKWSHDSKRIYFTTGREATLYSIAVGLPDAEPTPVQGFPWKNLHCCAISPDESLIVHLNDCREIRILTFPEGRYVARWEMPWPLREWATQLQWHPKKKTVILNSHSYHNQMGMVLFDVEQAEATHVFNLSRPWCNTAWSPDGSQLIVDPYSGQPWLLDIEPERPLAEALAPAMSTREFLGQLLSKWDQRIESDPLTAENRVSRALVAMAAKDYARARQDINHCGTLIEDPNDPARHAIWHWAFNYSGQGRYTEAELWALQNAQLVERFPEHSRSSGWYGWYGHPYQQLMRVYAAQGNIQEMVKWQNKWLQDHAFVPGSLSHEKTCDTYTLAGSGRNVGEAWDEFHFAYKGLQGNGSIVAKLEGIEDTHKQALAGVMIRSSFEADARHAAVFITPPGGMIFQHRRADRQEMFSNWRNPSSVELPHYIKLERAGSTFNAWHSPDGVYWEAIEPAGFSRAGICEVEMNEKVYIGLAVSSRAGPHVAAQATFSQVKITGNVTSAGPLSLSRDIGFSLDTVSTTEGAEE